MDPDYDYKEGLDRMIEFDRGIRDGGKWREIKFSHPLPNHEPRLPRRVEPEMGSTPSAGKSFFGGRPRCVLDALRDGAGRLGRHPSITGRTARLLGLAIQDLIKAIETGDYDAPGVLVKGQALRLEELDLSNMKKVEFDDVHIKLKQPVFTHVWVTNHGGSVIEAISSTKEFYGVEMHDVFIGAPVTALNAATHGVLRVPPRGAADDIGVYIDFKAWAAWWRNTNTSLSHLTDDQIHDRLKKKQKSVSSNWSFEREFIYHRFMPENRRLPDIDQDLHFGSIYEGPIDQMKAMKNPCGEISLSEPEPMILLTGQTNPADNGLYTIEGRVAEYGGSACLTGNIGALTPEEEEALLAGIPELEPGQYQMVTPPRFNLADFPHKCGCGAPCYNSGFSIQCTSHSCKHYKP